MQDMIAKDLGLSARDVRQYLIGSGYWADEELRARNACTLTPCALALSHQALRGLDRLARETYAALAATQARIHALANARSLSNADAAFVKLARRAARELLAPGECDLVPPVVKLDCVIAEDGSFKAVEVDAYNPRGYGYLALLDALVPKGKRVGGGIAELARRMRAISGGSWRFIVPEYERYYEPSFRILCAALAAEGMDARCVRESALTDTALFDTATFVIPDTLHASPQLRIRLMGLYRESRLTTFYPPCAYLGTKALLPAIAASGASAHVPATALVSRVQDPRATAARASLLKGVVSSGMKQVLFSDEDAADFERAYRSAREQKSPQWVLQEAVPQRPISITVFDDDGERITRPYYLRVIAYATRDGLLGAEVTGRPDRRVHGAPDCVQMPVIAR